MRSACKTHLRHYVFLERAAVGRERGLRRAVPAILWDGCDNFACRAAGFFIV